MTHTTSKSSYFIFNENCQTDCFRFVNTNHFNCLDKCEEMTDKVIDDPSILDKKDSLFLGIHPLDSTISFFTNRKANNYLSWPAQNIE
jgi:hypothetical protein